MRKLCAVMLCLAFMLAACQPTPEKQVVIQKDMEQMIEKAQKTPGITQEAAQGGLRERLGAPQRYTADIVDKSGKFYFKADVELTIPEVDAMPMAWVEAANFEQDMVTRLFDALCGDREMYVWNETISKNQIEKSIVHYQSEIAVSQSEAYTEMCKKTIENLKIQYKTAPESVEYKPCSGMLELMEISGTGVIDGTMEYLEAVENTEEKSGRWFLVKNNINYNENNKRAHSESDQEGNISSRSQRSDAELRYKRENRIGSILRGNGGKPVGDERKMIDISPEAAIKTAVDFLESVGIYSMEPNGIRLMSNHYSREELERLVEYTIENDEQEKIDRIIRDYGSIESFYNRDKEHQGYEIEFLRTMNGVKVASDYNATRSGSDDAYAAPEWANEKLSIVVNDEGIFELQWIQPLNVTELITGSAELLQFSEIRVVIEKMMEVIYGPFSREHENEGKTYEATSIELSLMRINARDTITKGLLVPVWSVYSEDSNNYNEKTSVLAVNAIDGSIIDLQTGY